MNERIKLLAEQATSYADTLDVADQKIYQEIRDREFAELIVLDICTVLENTHLDKRLQNNWDDCYLKLIKCVGMGFATFCREHFGFEK